MEQNVVDRPVTRGALRKLLGREYFILRRRLEWSRADTKFATTKRPSTLPYSAIRHRSFLRRPLKNVEMYLQENKITNLRLAIARIDGLILEPGETLSVWRLVGRPTRTRGFLEGLVLENGKIGKGVGGGLCQLGNLLYWMSLHTPLKITERWRHSFDVFPDIKRTIPFACGATLAYNYIDLQIKNDTSDTYQIKLWLDDEHLNGEIRVDREPRVDIEVFESDHLIKMQWWGGYTRHNRIWRRTKERLDGTIDEELIAENHAIMMYNPLLTDRSSS